MCYGDIDYGKDGYYRKWLEEKEIINDQRTDTQEGDREGH
jgi:hypothetical protein